MFASIIICSLFYLRTSIKKAVYYSSFGALLVVLMLFAINFLFAINPQSLTKYSFFGISIFTTVLALFYFNNQGDKESFIKSLYFVLKMILFHSIFNFVAYFFVKENLVLITSQYHESYTYNYLFYYSVKAGSELNFFGLDIHRNSGIFWEPGILQIYLNILFFLEASIFNRSKKLLALIILGILLCYSTTGLFLLILQMMYFLQKKFRTKLGIVLMSIIVIPLYIIFSGNMNEKIYGEGESSFQKRLFDLTQPLFIALDHPLTGVGLDLDRFQEVREEFYIDSDLNAIFRQLGIEQKVETTSKGSTNSVMYMLAGMGFPTAILFIFMFIKQQIITNNRVIWFIITFVSVMSEPLLFRPFFFIFIISGFAHFFYKVTQHKKQLA